MGGSEVEDDRIAFAIDEATVLPKLEEAGAIRSRAKECARDRNGVVFIGGGKFGSPNDLAVPVEQVTAIFERPCWRPQLNTSSRSVDFLVYNMVTLNLDKAALRMLSLTPVIFSNCVAVKSQASRRLRPWRRPSDQRRAYGHLRGQHAATQAGQITAVYVDEHNGADQVLVATLDHVSPGQIGTSDWIWQY